MKSQLGILQLLLVSCSLLATNATNQHCDKLRSQCNQLKAQCSPGMMTLKSCCDLTDLPLSKAPSKVYQITTNCSCGSPFTAAVDVYCDMDTSDGGWIVIQRNIQDGVKTFNRKLKDYEEGFGNLNGSKLWYGLKALHCFTKTGQWELRIDFQFANKTWSHLHYNHFSIGSASQQYKLNIGGFTGTTTDPFVTHPLNEREFSTTDNDNKHGCASGNESGWWYNFCYHINLNYQPAQIYLNSKWYNLLQVEMKVRQHDCTSQLE